MGSIELASLRQVDRVSEKGTDLKVANFDWSRTRAQWLGEAKSPVLGKADCLSWSRHVDADHVGLATIVVEALIASSPPMDRSRTRSLCLRDPIRRPSVGDVSRGFVALTFAAWDSLDRGGSLNRFQSSHGTLPDEIAMLKRSRSLRPSVGGVSCGLVASTLTR